MPNNNRLRDHQANERTFLAWLRTAIALIGFGFAIARFGIFLSKLQAAFTHQNTPSPSFLRSEIIGVALVSIGIVLIPLSLWRYNQVFRQIELEDYRPNRLLIWLTAGVVIILGSLTIPLILWRQLPNTQSPRSSDTYPTKSQ